jgi:hypothetical protein
MRRSNSSNLGSFARIERDPHADKSMHILLYMRIVEPHTGVVSDIGGSSNLIYSECSV